MPSEEIRYYEENVYSIEIASCARARVSDRFVLYGVACRVVSYRLVSSRLVSYKRNRYVHRGSLTYSRENNFTGRTLLSQLSIGRIKTKINYEHDHRLFRVAIVEVEERDNGRTPRPREPRL